MTTSQAVGLVLLGILAFGILAYTRLVVPVVGLALLAGWVLHLELVATQPMDFHYLGDNLVYRRDPYLTRYVGTWYVWGPMLLAGAVAELGIRGGYGVAADHLRNVPSFPLSRRQAWCIASGCGVSFAACLYLAMGYLGVQAWSHQIEAFVGAVVVVTITLGGLLTRGLVAPLGLSILLVARPAPRIVVRDGLGSSFLVLLLVAPLFVLVAVVEWYVRYRSNAGGRTTGFRSDTR